MLPHGSARKVTLYLNQDTRTHGEPLWSAILAFLRHKHVAGATVFRSAAGFGAHEHFHSLESEYVAEHSAIRVEFVDTAQRVDDLLPTLYDMVTDGLMTVQEVMVVKSVAKDAKPKPLAPETQKKIIAVPAKLVRVYVGESDQHNGEPLYEAIIKRLRLLDFSGATVYRGILGYGATRQTHKEGRFHLSRHLPIMISVIERTERVDELVRVLAEMLQNGIIATSDVEWRQVVHQLPAAGENLSHQQPT